MGRPTLAPGRQRRLGGERVGPAGNVGSPPSFAAGSDVFPAHAAHRRMRAGGAGASDVVAALPPRVRPGGATNVDRGGGAGAASTLSRPWALNVDARRGRRVPSTFDARRAAATSGALADRRRRQTLTCVGDVNVGCGRDRSGRPTLTPGRERRLGGERVRPAEQRRKPRRPPRAPTFAQPTRRNVGTGCAARGRRTLSPFPYPAGLTFVRWCDERRPRWRSGRGVDVEPSLEINVDAQRDRGVPSTLTPGPERRLGGEGLGLRNVGSPPSSPWVPTLCPPTRHIVGTRAGGAGASDVVTVPLPRGVDVRPGGATNVDRGRGGGAAS